MRIKPILALLIATTPLIGCERESDNSGPPPAVTTAPTSRRFAPSTSLLAVTQPSTQSASTVDSSDSLATPDAAVTQMFQLMQKQDVTGVRAMLADPMPAEQLRGEIAKVAERLSAGAKWQIVDSRTEGVAAIVLFRTTFPDGKQDLSPNKLGKR